VSPKTHINRQVTRHDSLSRLLGDGGGGGGGGEKKICEGGAPAPHGGVKSG
jgi:hypothetical protein